MKNLFIACAIAAIFTSGTALARDLSATSMEGHAESAYVEKGLAIPGSKIHNWFMANVPHAATDTPIAYEFSGKGDAAAIFASGVERGSLKAGRRANVDYPTPEPPPEGTLGAVAQMNLPCWPVSNGTGQQANGHGDATFNWEYQYQDDTDGDGKNDSNPGWVLVSSSVTNVEWHTQSGALGC